MTYIYMIFLSNLRNIVYVCHVNVLLLLRGKVKNQVMRDSKSSEIIGSRTTEQGVSWAWVGLKFFT